MASRIDHTSTALKSVEKAPSGIQGLDEITQGGLPRGRVTLICGGPGSGKTLFGMEFLVQGILKYGEPGIFMSFEETAEELSQNVASLGYDLKKLGTSNKLRVDHVHIERGEIEETGAYDLEGLFIRISYAIEQTGAKRIVLDTLEGLFSSLSDLSILRAEIRRLFRYLKDKKLTVVVTAELGREGRVTRYGLEEYVSDCVIQLDNRVVEQVSTRRIRVMKYRGSLHGTNEYPFLIDRDGFFIMPVTSIELRHAVSSQRVSSGISKLDLMLDGKGFYKGSTILVTGTAGTGKTSVLSSYVDSACRRGEKVLYFTYEESDNQIIRNMQSVGIDFGPWVKSGLLKFSAIRPTYYGLEQHLAFAIRMIMEFKPASVIVDPVSDLINIGTRLEVRMMLARLIDFLKTNGITALLSDLIVFESRGYGRGDDSNQAYGGRTITISSLVDTWILLREIESNGERNRAIQVLKSRGMPHSNQIRELVLSSRGLDLIDVYIGPNGVLIGSSKLYQEYKNQSKMNRRRAKIEMKQRDIERKRNALEVEIKEKWAKFQEEETDMKLHIHWWSDQEHLQNLQRNELSISRSREKSSWVPPIDSALVSEILKEDLKK